MASTQRLQDGNDTRKVGQTVHRRLQRGGEFRRLKVYRILIEQLPGLNQV
ncbi:MAG: hypothetical protein KDJ39_14925 [Gammaproteobacteria bacterium]|nr:hypothetical protein [Gammaproteobacteria bacterium]MCP5298096.1 hypothetical protein [Chromatiaceae bacterium]